MKIKKRFFLKNKKVKEIKKELGNFQDIIPKKSQVELVKIEDYPDILLIDGKPLLMQIDGKTIPTLHAMINEDIQEKYATVDMGAINFVIKGADIMSPGIVDADETIEPGDTIVIIEETHHKPLAIGISLITGKEMVDNNKGKAIKNLHYIGDSIWELRLIEDYKMNNNKLKYTSGNVISEDIHQIGIIALGSHRENHGTALPIDTDSKIAANVALNVATKTGATFLGIFYGATEYDFVKHGIHLKKDDLINNQIIPQLINAKELLGISKCYNCKWSWW